MNSKFRIELFHLDTLRVAEAVPHLGDYFGIRPKKIKAFPGPGGADSCPRGLNLIGPRPRPGRGVAKSRI